MNCGTAVAVEPGVSEPIRVPAIRITRSDATSKAAPVVFLNGGPGGRGVVDVADWLSRPLLQRHDLILYDARGTALVTPLPCPELGAGVLSLIAKDLDASAELEERTDLVGTCLSAMPASLRDVFATPNMVTDIDAIRRMFGYERLSVYTVSYGTRIAMAYADTYPQHLDKLLSTHRHRGFDIYFLTQYPNKVHHNVRALIGSHTHMNRSMGLAAAGVLTWSAYRLIPTMSANARKRRRKSGPIPKTFTSGTSPLRCTRRRTSSKCLGKSGRRCRCSSSPYCAAGASGRCFSNPRFRPNRRMSSSRRKAGPACRRPRLLNPRNHLCNPCGWLCVAGYRTHANAFRLPEIRPLLPLLQHRWVSDRYEPLGVRVAAGKPATVQHRASIRWARG